MTMSAMNRRGSRQKRSQSVKTSRSAAARSARQRMMQAGVHCLHLNLLRAARSVTVQYDRAVAPAKMSSNRFSILMTLGMSEHFTLRTLGETLSLDRTTLIRNLAPLSEQGLVQDLPPGPRNERRIALSAEGFQAVEKAYPLWLNAHRQMMAMFGDESYRDLIRKLRRVSATRRNPVA